MTVPLYNLTDTWTDGGSNTAIKMNVTDTFSASNSYVIDLQVGGTTVFSVNKDGLLYAANSVSTPILVARDDASWAITQGGTFSEGYKLSNNNILAWSPTGLWWGGVDLSLFRVTTGVLGIEDSTGSTPGGYIQWGGQARASADFTKSADTSLANITGITVNVQAGRTYSFTAEILYTCTAAGGVKAAIAGTCTATNVIYNGYLVDSGANGTKGNTQATALATTVASSTTTGTDGVIRIMGTITVNAAGTLTVQFAQNTATGSSVAKRGSFFIVNDMP